MSDVLILIWSAFSIACFIVGYSIGQSRGAKMAFGGMYDLIWRMEELIKKLDSETDKEQQDDHLSRY